MARLDARYEHASVFRSREIAFWPGASRADCPIYLPRGAQQHGARRHDGNMCSCKCTATGR